MSTNDASTPPETSDPSPDPAVDAPSQPEEESPATAALGSPEKEPPVSPASPEDKAEPQPATPSEPEEMPAQEVAEATQEDVKDDSSPVAIESAASEKEESSQETAQEPALDLQHHPDQELAQESVGTAFPQEKPASDPEPPKPYTKKDYAEHYRAIAEFLIGSPDNPLNRKHPLTYPLWPKHRRWAYEDKIDDEAMIFQRAVFAERSTSDQARFALTKGKARGWEVADRWTTFSEHKDPAIRELYQEVFPRDAKKYERWKKFMAAEGRPF